MPAPDLGFHLTQLSPQPKCSKLIVIYILVLLLSLGFTAGQRRPFNHQIDNRRQNWDGKTRGSFATEVGWTRKWETTMCYDNRDPLHSQENHKTKLPCVINLRDQKEFQGPEIDPFWYVGRGVRPIGRFGKRQLKFGRNSLRSGSSLDLILNALQEQEALEEALEEDGDVW